MSGSNGNSNSVDKIEKKFEILFNLIQTLIKVAMEQDEELFLRELEHLPVADGIDTTELVANSDLPDERKTELIDRIQWLLNLNTQVPDLTREFLVELHNLGREFKYFLENKETLNIYIIDNMELRNALSKLRQEKEELQNLLVQAREKERQALEDLADVKLQLEWAQHPLSSLLDGEPAPIIFAETTTTAMVRTVSVQEMLDLEVASDRDSKRLRKT